MEIKTLSPDQPSPQGLLFPHQVHGNKIIEIKTGQEDLSDCDGIWTAQKNNFPLGVQTADCAPIIFYDDEKYGLIHAGWRGCVNGVIEKMNALFDTPTIWIGPIYPQFQIQKDFCYEQIFEKFGDQFFKLEDQTLIFDFKTCLHHLLPGAQFDPRSTYADPHLASWRQDKTLKRNCTFIG